MNKTEEATFYPFESKLIKGLIIKRRNRFIMEVEVDGDIYPCHCPCTGRIGNVVFKNIPCLLSHASDPKRKTPYTVEAISVNHGVSYLGINQNAANRYVEYFIKNNALAKMIAHGETVQREQTLGNSRLDFKVSDTYLEVKTPLIELNCEIAEDIEQKKASEFASFERFIKHIHELSNSLQDHERAILLSCFMYDSPEFVPPMQSKHSEYIQENVKDVVTAGVELWQINLDIQEDEVSLISYHPIHFKFS